MGHFFDTNSLKKYLLEHHGVCENKPHETADQEMAVNSYLVDYDGDPKAKGLLAFCARNGMPSSATELIQAGADINDTYFGKSTLCYVQERLIQQRDSVLTTKHLFQLQKLLLSRGARSFTQKNKPALRTKAQNSR